MEYLKILTILFCSIILSSCMKANDTTNAFGNKILVAYYSWSGNTREMAEKIHNIVGGDTFEIVPQTPYSSDYSTCCNEAKKEIYNSIRPALKSNLHDISKYDVIFIGTPCWWGTMAPPVTTFLSENDLTGKTVIVFETNGGSGMANAEKDIQKLCTKSTFKPGLSIYGSPSDSDEQIKNWLKQLNFLK